MEFIKKIRFPENLRMERTEGIGQSMHSIQERMAAQAVKQTEAACIGAIIKAAEDAGLTELYVIDETFVLSALQEKIAREKEKQDNMTLSAKLADRDIFRKGRESMRREILQELRLVEDCSLGVQRSQATDLIKWIEA